MCKVSVLFKSRKEGGVCVCGHCSKGKNIPFKRGNYFKYILHCTIKIRFSFGFGTVYKATRYPRTRTQSFSAV